MTSSEPNIERAEGSYESRYGRFLLSSKDFVQQFCHMYARRLNQTKPQLKAAAKRKWTSADLVIFDQVIDSEGAVGSDCVLIGTLYKEMESKPSVLDEFKDFNGLMGATTMADNFTGKKDKLILEDDSGRVALHGVGITAETPGLVTGVMIAVKGYLDDLGGFQVKDWLFCGETLNALSSSSGSTTSDQNSATGKSGSPKLLLVSGLAFGSPDASPFTAQLLADFIGGTLGGEDQQAKSASICRVIVVGNSVCADLTCPEEDFKKETKEEKENKSNSSSSSSNAFFSQERRSEHQHQRDRSALTPIGHLACTNLGHLSRRPHARAQRPIKLYPPPAATAPMYAPEL